MTHSCWTQLYSFKTYIACLQTWTSKHYWHVSLGQLGPLLLMAFPHVNKITVAAGFIYKCSHRISEKNGWWNVTPYELQDSSEQMKTTRLHFKNQTHNREFLWWRDHMGSRACATMFILIIMASMGQKSCKVLILKKTF